MPSQVTPIAKRLGHNIRTARKAAGLTQRQLGALLGPNGGTDGMTVSRWERGAHRPDDDNLVFLAIALDRDIAWFYGNHDEVVGEAA